ncbi:conjugal transfer protein [Pseudomonas sp. BRG-100]|uniref:virB8 family protein n=1 Tax=Pseudomonas sp. BRG-100 TaxID=1524267 RepID=UPI0004E6FA7F|nr:type IV secretion system protein [Pseudomonas sp. BRG-100]KFF42181.1 conjugal transfer protein [Pseudomonas sp. BRG-100]
MMFRKNKRPRQQLNQVIEQEQHLAANVSIEAAAARNISLSEQAYIHAARWFESNVAAEHQRRARTWKRLAGFFGLLAFMSVGAVLGLTPLKTVETYLVRVDNNSGFTDVVKPASEVKSSEQIDDEYWLANYVRFRESYNFSDNDAQFSMVELMSYGTTFAEYRNFQLSSKGYLAVLGNNRQIKTDVNNVTFLTREDAKGTAQVRLTKTVLDRNGMPDPEIKPAVWLATISYDYKNPAKKRGDQWLNPRGFGVLSYSPTQEVGVGVSHEK